MSLYLEFDALVRAFDKAGIRYAVVGGLAVGLHGYLRATEDMDFLIHPEDIIRAIEVVRGLGYLKKGDPWTFKNSRVTLWRLIKPQKQEEDVHILDLMVPGLKKDVRIIENAEKLPYANLFVRTARRADLIRMKKSRGSKVDLGDIEKLKQKR